MKYGKWVVAAGALLALVLALSSIRGEPGPSVAEPAEGWSSEPVAAGQAALVLPTPEGDGCDQRANGVAAFEQRAWVSYACVPDEPVPPADPATAVDELQPDGDVERLEAPDDAFAPLTVEDVGPDGTLWALQQGAVLTRPPGGSWRTLESGPASTEDIVDLEVIDNGFLYLARRSSVTLVRPEGPPVELLSDPERGAETGTFYADEAVTGARPAADAPLPTLTGLTVLPNGTVVLLATDSVLTLDPQGALRTIVTPKSSGTDPATRLVRAVVRDGGSGSYLADAVVDEDRVLVYDQRAGRILRIGLDGRVELVAGRPANQIGGPEGGDVSGTDWGADAERVVPLGEVRLGIGGTDQPRVGMALLQDGQLLATTTNGGVVRLGLR